jgi:chaperonin GroEL
METVGKEAVITVKEGRAIDDGIEITEWMRFDRGLTSPRILSQTSNS